MKIPILYEDADILVLNKPAGLSVHEDGRTSGPFLTDWIVEKYPEVKYVGEPWVARDQTIDRPGIVHRLDKETSGAIVVAKNQNAYEFLKKQFKSRTVKKKYLAFVWGEFKDERGVIDRPIGKSRSDFRRRSAERSAKGDLREAVTVYHRLGAKDGISFVEVLPQTGRTHQIRVHFKAIQRPIVCDKLYAPERPEALGFKRLALHAESIEFTLPSGKQIVILAPLPEDFESAKQLLNS